MQATDLRYLGELTLQVWRVKDQSKATSDVVYEDFTLSSTEKVHERSKKAGGHRVQ
jgi:hypothetical protein